MSSYNENCCKKVVEKIKRHILCPVIYYYFFENPALYEIMWKNMIERGGPQMTIWHMRIACWIPKTTNTHTDYVILTVFPQQQWLHERASLLLYAYIACLVDTDVICCPNYPLIWSLAAVHLFESVANLYHPIWVVSKYIADKVPLKAVFTSTLFSCRAMFSIRILQ